MMKRPRHHACPIRSINASGPVNRYGIISHLKELATAQSKLSGCGRQFCLSEVE